MRKYTIYCEATDLYYFGQKKTHEITLSFLCIKILVSRLNIRFLLLMIDPVFGPHMEHLKPEVVLLLWTTDNALEYLSKAESSSAGHYLLSNYIFFSPINDYIVNCKKKYTRYTLVTFQYNVYMGSKWWTKTAGHSSRKKKFTDEYHISISYHWFGKTPI